MSTTPVQESIIVAATVKSKAETERGWKIELDIPSFKSQYPVVIYNVSSDDASLVTSGQAINATLKRGNLKKGKDGMFQTDYFWNWEGMAVLPATQPETAPPAGPAVASRDETRVSIERQTSLKEAVALYISMPPVTEKPMASVTREVITIASAFERFLATGLVPPIQDGSAAFKSAQAAQEASTPPTDRGKAPQRPPFNERFLATDLVPPIQTDGGKAPQRPPFNTQNGAALLGDLLARLDITTTGDKRKWMQNMLPLLPTSPNTWTEMQWRAAISAAQRQVEALPIEAEPEPEEEATP